MPDVAAQVVAPPLAQYGRENTLRAVCRNIIERRSAPLFFGVPICRHAERSATSLCTWYTLLTTSYIPYSVVEALHYWGDKFSSQQVYHASYGYVRFRSGKMS